MSVFSDDLSDYDVISDPGHRSLDSSVADLMHTSPEPTPAPEAYLKFATVRLTATDIQNWTRTSLGIAPVASTGSSKAAKRMSHGSDNRTKRVYVDGVFDIFNVGHALQFRQAKLSFPSVYLIAGVFSDQVYESYHGTPPAVSHLERCELLRHCRWIDEVLPDAPWQIDEKFLNRQNIDYVVLDEGATVDPGCDKVRLAGYDALKRIGKVILTKRTMGLTVVPPGLSSPATPKSPIETFPPDVEVPETVVEF